MAIWSQNSYKKVPALVWEQETVRSSRATRTKDPLEAVLPEGLFRKI